MSKHGGLGATAWPVYYLVTWEVSPFDEGYRSQILLARTAAGAKRAVVEAYDYATNVTAKRMETLI